jgi:hypothetical protein
MGKMESFTPPAMSPPMARLRRRYCGASKGQASWPVCGFVYRWYSWPSTPKERKSLVHSSG